MAKHGRRRRADKLARVLERLRVRDVAPGPVGGGRRLALRRADAAKEEAEARLERRVDGADGVVGRVEDRAAQAVARGFQAVRLRLDQLREAARGARRWKGPRQG